LNYSLEKTAARSEKVPSFLVFFMPTHTAASALIKLFFIDGHPWDWPEWQEITKICHGLFPTNNKLLPPGWTHEDANDIHSYFNTYNALPTEECKIKFAAPTKGSSAMPGRAKWASFISKSWSRWGIHTIIVSCLHKHGIHPITLLVQGSNLDGDWPSADTYVLLAIDSITLALFGIEAFPGSQLLLPMNLRKPLAILVH
jgi:hypothetical protein